MTVTHRVTAWRSFLGEHGLIIQGDGSAYQWLNCAAATWAGLIVAMRAGSKPLRGSPWHPSGASIRSASGDRSGGILPSVLDAVANRVYALDLIPRIAKIPTVQALLEQRYPLGLLVDYGPIDDTPGMSGSPGFREAHSIGVYGTQLDSSVGTQWLDADPLYDNRRPGIPDGMKWASKSVLIRAGQALMVGDSSVRERYGSDSLYIVQPSFRLLPATSTPTPLPPTGIVVSAPATAEEKLNPMVRGAYGVTSSKVMRLAKGQPVYANPGGPRVTAMSAAAAVSYIGPVGPNWALVLVGTGSPYADKATRPTGVYVPRSAGTVLNR